MEFIRMPSLLFRVLVKIAATLWNYPDIRPLVLKFVPGYSDGHMKGWKKIEDRIRETTLNSYSTDFKNYPLPERIKQKICGIINQVGLRILAWKEFHYKNCNFTELPKRFVWTPQGTIDKIKTIKMLIIDEHLSVADRYNLACLYCLGSDVRRLWNELGPSELHGKNLENIEEYQPKIVAFWSRVVVENVPELCYERQRLSNQSITDLRILKGMFLEAVARSNEVAAVFFLEQINPAAVDFLPEIAQCTADRISCAVQKIVQFPVEYSADVWCFLLSRLSSEQKKDIYDNYAFEILACFLEWRRQHLFRDVFYFVCFGLSRSDYYCLLQYIADKIELGFEDYDYKMLFQLFWENGGNYFRTYVAELSSDGVLLAKLLRGGDISNAKMVLDNIPASEKRELPCNIAKDLLWDLASAKSWLLLNLFFQECQPSKRTVRMLKLQFHQFVLNSQEKTGLSKYIDIVGKFDGLLDHFIQVKEIGGNNQTNENSTDLEATPEDKSENGKNCKDKIWNVSKSEVSEISVSDMQSAILKGTLEISSTSERVENATESHRADERICSTPEPMDCTTERNPSDESNISETTEGFSGSNRGDDGNQADVSNISDTQSSSNESTETALISTSGTLESVPDSSQDDDDIFRPERYFTAIPRMD